MSNLIEQLNEICPQWRLEYGDPLTAGVELGLLEPSELEADYQPLNFNDEDANWRRYYEEIERLGDGE